MGELLYDDSVLQANSSINILNFIIYTKKSKHTHTVKYYSLIAVCNSELSFVEKSSSNYQQVAGVGAVRAVERSRSGMQPQVSFQVRGTATTEVAMRTPV